MKNKLLIVLLLLFIGFMGNAQTPTFVGQTSATAFGSGATGRPTLSWNIPPGKDRVMIITVVAERYHNPLGENFPATPSTAGVGILVDGTTATYINGRIYRDYEGVDSFETTKYSFSHSLYYLSDANGDLPTGNANFTFTNLNNPKSAGDEMIITATVYQGVKEVVDFAYTGIRKPLGDVVSSTSGSHLTVGTGVTAANILYFGLGASSQNSSLIFAPSTWTVPTSIVLNNNGGPGPSGVVNEPNGIALQVGHRTFTTSSTPTLTVTKSSSADSNRGVANMVALMPFARPSVSGTVYRDNNGLTGGINGGGVGGGPYDSTTPNLLYVNVLNATGTSVVARATVNSSGLFNIPAGTLVEGTTYILQLSKNQGTVGGSAPAKELHANWTTVGESSTGSTSDGSPNGLLTITLGDTDSTTNRFGVTICTAGNTAPPVQNITNICPATTVNLTSAHTGTAPGTTAIRWYKSSDRSTPVLTGTNVTAAGAGTYYAFYYDSAGDCYSPVSSVVTVTINTAPAITTPPSGATYCQNGTATALSVTATGTSLSYQWYRNTTNSTSGGTAVGTNSSTYTPVITASGTLYYYAVVSSGTCSTTSTVAAVSVTAKPATPVVTSGSTLSNSCPVATVNLTTLQPATVTGIDYEWHTVSSNPTTATKVGTPTAVSVSGTYYLYSKTTTGDCYSNASNAVIVTISGCQTCTNSGVTSVDLTQLFTGTLPGPNVIVEWWTSPTRDLPPTPGTKVLNPTNVTVSGTYYAFFYDTANNCHNTNNSTASVVVNILPPCATCTNPGSTAIGGDPTKVGITVQQKQEGWPTNIPNGFIALQSKEKGFVITRVATVGNGTGGAPNLSTDSIKDPKEGMLVYDLAADCVKLFNGTIWKCLAKDCN